MSYGLILDAAVAGLLVAALVYMVRLNRRLDAFRAGREEFEALVKRFTTATEQAQGNVAAMKAAAEGTGKSLQEEIDRARGLREDLSFLADRANGLADQLERAITRGRPAAAGAAPAAPSGAAPGPAPTASLGPNVARMPSRAEEPRPAPAQPNMASGAAPRFNPGLSSSENELLRRLSTLR